MPERGIIEAAWLNYRRVTMNKNIGPAQYLECRRAFYAGSHAFFAAGFEKLTKKDKVSKADVARLESLVKELQEFSIAVRAGLA